MIDPYSNGYGYHGLHRWSMAFEPGAVEDHLLLARHENEVDASRNEQLGHRSAAIGRRPLEQIRGRGNDDEVVMCGEVAYLALDVHVGAAIVREVNGRRSLLNAIFHSNVVRALCRSRSGRRCWCWGRRRCRCRGWRWGWGWRWSRSGSGGGSWRWRWGRCRGWRRRRRLR